MSRKHTGDSDKEKLEILIPMLKNGSTLREMAEAIGIDRDRPSTVKNLLNRNGYHLITPKPYYIHVDRTTGQTTMLTNDG